MWKKNINIPNMISVFRIILIPIFIYMYLNAKNNTEIIYSALVLILSGFTDLFDGLIARKFNMITDLGKILDPIADKLTQVAVVVCIAIKMRNLMLACALALFVIKEVLMLIGGMIMLKNKVKIGGARWYGKVATGVFYIVMVAIALFDLSDTTNLILVLVAAAFMVFAFTQYIKVYIKCMQENKQEKNEHIIVEKV